MNIPVFPNQFGSKSNQGITLRDYFAAKAMQAMLAHPDSKETASPQTYANAAYIMAKAMLEARGE